MTSSEAFKLISKSLIEIYYIGEAVSIATIVMEDAFHIKLADIPKNSSLSDSQQADLKKIIKRLLKNEPVQYVLGKTVFFGMPLIINSKVLIPRQETEELVAWVIETVDERRWTACPEFTSGVDGSLRGNSSTVGRNYRALDIGTGSGCIPISIKHKLPDVEMHALDVSKNALEVARENAAVNNVDIIFHEVDILNEKAWAALPMVDIIVSNPPYITQNEKIMLEKNVIDFEPHIALFSGNNDAQRFVKKIVKFATGHLNKNGYLFFETNEFYAPDSKIIMEENGFAEVELRKDLNGRDRMLRGVKS